MNIRNEEAASGRDSFPLIDQFRDTNGPDSNLVLATLRAGSLLDEVIARSLAPYDLHHAQYQTLVLLRDCGQAGLRPSKLGALLCVSRPNVTKLLSRLVARKLIEERPDPDDGRAVLAFATADGLELVKRASETLSRDCAHAVAALPPADAHSLRLLLDRFRDVLACYLARNTG